jgi:hypothetical protein
MQPDSTYLLPYGGVVGGTGIVHPLVIVGWRSLVFVDIICHREGGFKAQEGHYVRQVHLVLRRGAMRILQHLAEKGSLYQDFCLGNLQNHDLRSSKNK